MSERRKLSHENLVYQVIFEQERVNAGEITPVVLSKLVSLVKEENPSIDKEMIRTDIENMLGKKLFLFELIDDNFVGVEQKKISLDDLNKNTLLIASKEKI
nr:hypothetical protein [uncultured Ligilactobacillus sp.]